MLCHFAPISDTTQTACFRLYLIHVACFQSLPWMSIAKCPPPPPHLPMPLPSACSSCHHCCDRRHHHCHCHSHDVLAAVALPSPLCNIFCGDCKGKKLLSYVFSLFFCLGYCDYYDANGKKCDWS